METTQTANMAPPLTVFPSSLKQTDSEPSPGEAGLRRAHDATLAMHSNSHEQGWPPSFH